VILAAGQGTRMKSALPKVMHTLAGRPLIYFPVRAALDAGCSEIVVVVGHGRELVSSYLAKTFGDRVKTAVQSAQRGTGHAAKVGIDAVTGSDAALVFYGDVPLLVGSDIAPVLRGLEGHGASLAGDGPREAGTWELALATCLVADAHGYGRILRDARGDIVEIREQKDLRTDAERAVREINPGLFAAKMTFWQRTLAQLSPNNAQGELYLTDVVALARRAEKVVHTVSARNEVLLGVNDRQQLIEAEVFIHERIARDLRRAGVTVRAGARIDDGVRVGRDAVIETAVVLRGDTSIGEGATIDVGCVLTNAVVDAGAVLKPYSVLTDSHVGARAQIGPFSHLRPDSDIGEEAHVGNFVETKKTRLGRGAKANHLAYLGDGIVGASANIGAGTIFCNYDGYRKHTTVIGEGAFIGSDSQIVAPVTVGDGAYVATGTTVTRDIPANALAISRVRQENKEGYASRLRAKLKPAAPAKPKTPDIPPKGST
ncbi:MAG TPA: bifunctional UDP-N-acetylglucosamine diphosphorylase/glucosamine-1-phosphate N-acetyltransferase GlmU, partial [Polyangiaceae bacterium]|nr:bifunctional UDP-N-acetylglucosamine diphosphorylase/glucosamine-1-phosphate N-acetyltransferase GlmU [Polyangiaceae bacterium]